MNRPIATRLQLLLPHLGAFLEIGFFLVETNTVPVYYNLYIYIICAYDRTHHLFRIREQHHVFVHAMHVLHALRLGCLFGKDRETCVIALF